MANDEAERAFIDRLGMDRHELIKRKSFARCLDALGASDLYLSTILGRGESVA